MSSLTRCTVSSFLCLLAATSAMATGCDPDVEAQPSRSESGESGEDEGGEAQAGGPPVSFDELRLGPNWEPTANPVPRSGSSGTEGSQGASPSEDLTDEELAEQAEQDPAWRAADGTRYEAMLVLPDGTSYGRRGPAPEAQPPEHATRFAGNNAQDAPEADVPDEAVPPVDPEGIVLGGYLWTDRRTRVTSTTGFPEKAIGALNDFAGAGETFCTGTKVGPRAVLTAAHCVLVYNDSTYRWEYDTNGFFHPGQTNDSHPNSANAIGYAGAYLRDWRVNRRYDYSVVFIDDTPESVNLGWLNPAYFTNSTSYHGLNARLLGYPKKTDNCLASPLSNNDCDGWMYRDQDLLDYLTADIPGELRYDIDSTRGQSGAAVFTNLDNSWVILGVHWGHAASDPNYNRAARFRDHMWNDVCEWIETFPTSLFVPYNCG